MSSVRSDSAPAASIVDDMRDLGFQGGLPTSLEPLPCSVVRRGSQTSLTALEAAEMSVGPEFGALWPDLVANRAKRNLKEATAQNAAREHRASTEPLQISGVTSCGFLVMGSRGIEYAVDLHASTCTCPDHKHRGNRCKHLIFAENRRAKEAEGVAAPAMAAVPVDNLTRHVVRRPSARPEGFKIELGPLAVASDSGRRVRELGLGRTGVWGLGSGP